MNLNKIKNNISLIKPYLSKKIFITLSMGFVSGVPLLLTITLLQAWLTEEGISRSTIGLFALVGLPYSLKFLWAPIFDGITLEKRGESFKEITETSHKLQIFCIFFFGCFGIITTLDRLR